MKVLYAVFCIFLISWDFFSTSLTLYHIRYCDNGLFYCLSVKNLWEQSSLKSCVSSTTLMIMPVRKTGFFCVQFLAFFTQRAFFQSFSQIALLISCQRTNSGKILKKNFHVFHKDLAYFCTIIGYYTRFPLDFNPYRKKPLQSPLQKWRWTCLNWLNIYQICCLL